MNLNKTCSKFITPKEVKYVYFLFSHLYFLSNPVKPQ